MNSNLFDSRVDVPKVVVARGNPRARFMLIGEAPGAMENKIGKPFVGRSGKVLDEILISSGFDLSKDVYICNLVKIRPPNNRRPTKKEILAALPWLQQQIKLVDPWVIALAGSTALESFLGKKMAITNYRGKWIKWEGRKIMPLFHPAYLLRNPSEMKDSPKWLTKNDLLVIHNKLKTYEPSTSMPYFSAESVQFRP